MEDTKVLAFINANHEKSYENHVKTQKRKNKRNTIHCIILVLAILTLVLVLGSVIHQETQKAVKKCVKMGYSIESCTRDAQ